MKRIFKFGRLLSLVFLLHTVEFIIGNFKRAYTVTYYEIDRENKNVRLKSYVYLPSIDTEKFWQHERMHLLTNEWYIRNYYYESESVIKSQLYKLHKKIDGCN